MLILYVDLVMSCNYIVASSHWTEIVEDHGKSIILEMAQLLEESSAYGYSMICLRSMPCSGAQLSTSQNLREMETLHFLAKKQEETWATWVYQYCISMVMMNPLQVRPQRHSRNGVQNEKKKAMEWLHNAPQRLASSQLRKLWAVWGVNAFCHPFITPF